MDNQQQECNTNSSESNTENKDIQETTETEVKEKNNCCEVEVIDTSNYNITKGIEKRASLRAFIVQNSFCIINGVKRPSMIYMLCCPTCGRQLFTFNQPGITSVDVNNFIREHKEDLQKDIKCCSNCGQKLYFDSDIVLEIVENN